MAEEKGHPNWVAELGKENNRVPPEARLIIRANTSQSVFDPTQSAQKKEARERSREPLKLRNNMR
jgi:hypothetical protein